MSKQIWQLVDRIGPKAAAQQLNVSLSTLQDWRREFVAGCTSETPDQAPAKPRPSAQRSTTRPPAP